MTRTTADAERFDELIGFLHSAFGKAADELTLGAYEMGLADLPIAAIGDAVALAIKTSKFVPTVFELRKLAGFDVSPEGRAMIAFAALSKAMKDHGSYKSVVFGDPILNQTIADFGGWIKIGEVSDENWQEHFRRNFLSNYKENAAARRGTMAAQYGINEQANAGGPFADRQPPPVQIAVDLPRILGLSYEPVGETRKGLANIGGLLQLKDANQGEKP
jgi:hypothetical protein